VAGGDFVAERLAVTITLTADEAAQFAQFLKVALVGHEPKDVLDVYHFRGYTVATRVLVACERVTPEESA